MKEYIKEYKDELRYIGYELKDNVYYIYCETKSKSMKHPKKDIISKSVKLKKRRIVKDIPFNDHQVKLIITIKLYSFRDENGKKYSIREPLNFIAEEKRDTSKRLYKYILDNVSSQSSHSAELIFKKHGIMISDTTIDRMIKKTFLIDYNVKKKQH